MLDLTYCQGCRYVYTGSPSDACPSCSGELAAILAEYNNPERVGRWEKVAAWRAKYPPIRVTDEETAYNKQLMSLEGQRKAKK